VKPTPDILKEKILGIKWNKLFRELRKQKKKVMLFCTLKYRYVCMYVTSKVLSQVPFFEPSTPFYTVL